MVCVWGMCGEGGGVVDTPQSQRQTPLPPSLPVETATEAGGMHPTGMHSFLFFEIENNIEFTQSGRTVSF